MVLWCGMENWVRKITQPSTSASTQCLCIFYVNIYVRCTCWYHEHYKATGDALVIPKVYTKNKPLPCFSTCSQIDDKYVYLEKNVLFSWHLSTILRRHFIYKKHFSYLVHIYKWFCAAFRLKSTYHSVMNEMIPTHHQIKLGWNPLRMVRKTYFLLRNMLYKQFFQLCIVRQVKGRPSSRIVIW